MATSRMVKCLLDDIRKTVEELYNKNLVRDYIGVSEHEKAKDYYELSFSGKDKNVCNIVYDKHVSGESIIDALLEGRQYTLLLYDKSIIQVEFVIKNEKIIKERLVFLKRHNRLWSREEIDEDEINDQDWFSSEKGIPIIFRIDYAPEDADAGNHSATHFTMSNHQSCRIPIKGIINFSEFIRFILLHFYDIELELKSNNIGMEETIAEIEKHMIHLNWE